LAGERERYLRQQSELGGREVVLSGRTGGAPGSPASAADDAPERSAEGDVGTKGRSESKPGEGKWRKGAPKIPGEGIAVHSPDVAMVGDPLSGLDTLDEVAKRIRTTYCCDLCPQRTNAVPGEGNPNAELVLIGEGPGATEDETGRPFVGAAGRLLEEILGAVDLQRSDVFICNVVKCRPPQNRKPLPDEIAACMPYLHRQLALIRPKVILTLGGTAAEALLGVKQSLGKLRGQVHTYDGIPLIATYHPAALLRNPDWKKPTWDDVRIARQLLER
jgi:uracil-DNA glycosylase family 4